MAATWDNSSLIPWKILKTSGICAKAGGFTTTTATIESATLPLKAVGRRLEADVALPADWQGKNVYLEFEVADRWVGIVVINGRAIAYNQSLHPYPNIMQVNLYPWARPGRSNRIELWPRSPEETPRAQMTVERVRIGTVGRCAATGGTGALPLLPAAANTGLLPASAANTRTLPVAPGAGASGGQLPPRRPRPIILNGGFEHWSPLRAQQQGDAMVKNVVLSADHLAPDGWIPGRELGKQPNLTGKILPDATVKHSGRYSARLENADPRDITVLQYSTQHAESGGKPAILPNHRYVVRWWVKGQRVENADAGAILMMNVVSAKRGGPTGLFPVKTGRCRKGRSTGSNAA